MFKLFLPIILAFATFITSGDMIHACVDKESGTVRIVSADSDCESDESALEWGIVGVQGPQGEPGPAGPQGPKGDMGPKGDAGVGDIGCTASQFAKWDGGKWVCSNDLANLQNRVAALEELLAHFSRDDNTVMISGANLQVVNGTGTTDGSTNGLGNIIIGYNEVRTGSGGNIVPNIRTGSHMLVVGQQHNYTGFGGIVVGLHHTVSGDYAAVSGGRSNTATGNYSAVSGGSDNTASGTWATVSGGANNIASGGVSSISGGVGNTASGGFATVSGGGSNTASGNTASISGGANRSVDGDFDWRAGNLFEDN